MPRKNTNKTTKSTPVAQPEPEEPVASGSGSGSESEPEVVPVKKTRGKRTKKATKAAEAAVVEETAEPESVSGDPSGDEGGEESEVEELSVEDRLQLAVETVDLLAKSLRDLTKELRAIKREHAKVLKVAQKRKRGVRDPNKPKRKPSGFAKETLMSPQLCKFLGVSEDTRFLRTQVTKKISAYIRENKLFMEENKRRFVPEKGSLLAKILGKPRFPYNKNKPEEGNGYCYFNLQSYLKDHFIAPKVEETTPASS